MKMKKVMVFVLMIAMMVCVASASFAETTNSEWGKGEYYVYTRNGKNLNVREAPYGKIVGTFKCGEKVQVEAFADGTWAMVQFKYDEAGSGKGEYTCFVNRRFLTKKAPGNTTVKQKEEPDDAITEINQEFRSTKKVDPYTVYVRPTRVSGWVGLYWGPSVETELEATLKSRTALTVLQETENWLQVQDPATGNVGFINRQYIEQ
jgi:uncharacterized protein YgiM (DUF1202 family)